MAAAHTTAKIHPGRCLLPALLAAGLLAGCASNDPATNYCAQAGGAGAVGGALLGALVSNNRAQGALIGAAAGGALGCAGGAAIGSAQTGYANTEMTVAAQTQSARQATAAIRTQATQANRSAAGYEASLGRMRGQLASGGSLGAQQQRTLRQAQAEREQMRQTLAGASQNLAGVDQSIQALRQQGQNTADLERERQAMQGSVAQLEGAVERMNRALGGVGA